ncbi:MAG: dienelactone hydrolase family protein [Ginsengibacter sp.]
MEKLTIKVELNDVTLTGNLNQSPKSRALVIFAHGSGSSRLSPRNNYVADILNQHQIATLLTDLLTPEEDEVYENRFNTDLLTDRLIRVTEKMLEQIAFDILPIGYFGASTGAASALDAAAFLGDTVKAIVCRGGRVDMAKNLPEVKAQVLLIVGSLDLPVIDLNQKAYQSIRTEKKMKVVEGASHLFEEPGTLDEVANLAADWFELHLCNQTLTQNTL